MKRKVIITKLPKAQSGLDVKMQGLKAGLGFNANQMPWPVMAGKMAKPDIEVNSTLQPVPRDQANLEAEEGEVAMLPSKSGIPSTFKVGGNRHHSGGTPLSLPQDSFIYSDTRDMRIKDQKILAQFGITVKGGYTPAEIAKKYDVNKWKKVLLDPDTDKIQRDTAEGMIANYNLKLAKLALYQESMKGFPQGIPAVAMPYIESQQINPAEFIQMNPQGGETPTVDDEDQMEFGGIIGQLRKASHGGPMIDYFQEGGYKKVVQPKRSDRVVLNPATGEYEVFNWAGKKVGVMNVPQPVQQQMQQQQNVGPTFNPQTGVYNPGTGVATGTNPQGGGQQVNTTTSNQTTKKVNIPEGAVVIKRGDYKTEEEYIAARNKAYTDNPGKPVYTQTADGGSYSKVVVTPANQPKDQMDHLNLVKTNFSDPKVQQALYDKTLAAAEHEGTTGRKSGFKVETRNGVKVLVDPTTGTAMTPADVSNQFIEMQTRNLEGNKIMQQEGLKYEWFDNTTGKIKPEYKSKSKYGSLDEIYAQTSVGAPKSDFNKGIQQLSYIGYNDLIQDNRAGNIKDPTLSGLLKPFKVSQYGVSDEKLRDKQGTISKADTYYTNTTFGQIAGYENPEEIKEEVVPGEEVPGKPETKANPLVEPPPPAVGSPWWLQDIIKTAHAAGNFARVKKYNPWQATPGVVTPEVTFYDPTRELAANAEQTNIAAQNLAQFTGPQAFNARFNQVQGQALKNAADINARYNNLNVGVSNQQEAQNADIMNQHMLNRAGLSTQLWDKYQTVNQQFDNAKNEARNALVQQYVNAITNKNYTANLNKMYPQFAVNPAIGGEYYFHDPRALKPDFTQQPDFTSTYNKLLEENPTLKAFPEKAADIAMKQLGMSTTNEDAFLEYQKNRGVVPQYPGGYGS